MFKAIHDKLKENEMKSQKKWFKKKWFKMYFFILYIINIFIIHALLIIHLKYTFMESLGSNAALSSLLIARYIKPK